MKPHSAPLELRSYFVTELQLTSNTAFDPAKPMQLDTADLQIDSTIEPPTEGKDQWGISLSVQQTLLPGKNAPYAFTIKIWGMFVAAKGLPEEKRNQIMLTTGSSMLYGAAREIVRDLTSRGPFASLLLPTMSFYPLAESASEAPVPAKEK